jgi:hypothetical protein
MIKSGLFLLSILLAAISTNGPMAKAQTQDHKVTICHIPPGNPDNAHTIVIDFHALPAHLDHGDFIGACEDGGID